MLRVLAITVLLGSLQGQQDSDDSPFDSSTLPGGTFPGLIPGDLLPSLDLPPVPCTSRNRCGLQDGAPLTYHDRNCFCDDLCHLYGDCCRDNEDQPGRPGVSLDLDTVSCRRVMEIDPEVELYIVDSCPEGYSDTEVRQKCDMDTDLSWTNGLAFYRLPVTGKHSGILYKNFHCAQCAGDMDVIFWNVQVGCSEVPENLNTAPPRKVINDVLQYTREGKYFCGLEFVHDQVSARHCKTNINRCDRSYKDKRIRKKCRSHTAYVYVGKQVFKNKYCAVCNYVNESYLSCEDTRTPKGMDIIPHLGLLDVTAPLIVTLDLDTGLGKVKENRVGVAGLPQQSEVSVDLPRCQENHVYDPFAATCRQLLCHGDEVLVDGRCVPHSARPTTLTSSTVLPTSATPTMFGIQTRPPVASNPIDPNADYFVPEPPDIGNSDYIDAGPGFDISAADDDSSYTENQDACRIVTLNSTQYLLLNNLSLLVYDTQQWYSSTEYEQNGDQVTLCARDSLTVEPDSRAILMFQYDRLQNLVSFVGTLVSMVAMFIQFVVYLMVAPLRTAAGKSLMSLSFSLCAAQALLQFAVNQTNIFYLCFGFGIAMHYFFLVAFVWMNVLAYDIWRTFTSRDSEKASDTCCRFACYSLYAWLMPAFIVGGTVALDFLSAFVEDKYRPHYGHGLCWIVRRYAILFLFALPIALLLAANIILYIISMRNIYIISQANKYEQPKERHRGRFVAYILLSLIMGLTWVFAHLATLTNMHFLWYAFITLNCLTGVYICFVFVCNRKVLRLLREKGRVHREHNGRYYPYRGNYSRHTFLSDGEAKIISQETSI